MIDMCIHCKMIITIRSVYKSTTSPPRVTVCVCVERMLKIYSFSKFLLYYVLNR